MVDKLKREGEPICYILNQEETERYLSTYMWQIAEFADETKRECEIETSIKNEVLTEQMITDLGLRIHRVYEG